MSANKKKASVVNRRLAEYLRRRLAAVSTSLVVTEGLDASNNPQIVINDGSWATSENAAFIRVLEYPVIGTNSVGISAESYGPHIVQIAFESSAAAGIAFPTEAFKSIVVSGGVATGARVEIYLSATTVQPVVGTLVAGNLVSTIDQDLMFGIFAGT